ncbi:MAG: RedB protein [Myxococcales bacterium]|nr:RedB protein [Myxococcales bacterium]
MSHTRSSRQRDAAIVAGLILVLISAAIWLVQLTRYKATPGPSASTPALWPAQSTLSLSTEVPTLVMFTHPKCPCTAASLAELRVALSSALGKVKPVVAFASPDDGPEWKVSGFRGSAASIPGVELAEDPGRLEAHRFGALTSGHVVLYGADGRLRFSGGITPSRGHGGDNPGRRRLAAILENPALVAASTPVFGCELDEPGADW